MILSWSKSERLTFVLSDPSFVELVAWKSIGTLDKSSACEDFGRGLGIGFSMWPSGLCTGTIPLQKFCGAGFRLGLRSLSLWLLGLISEGLFSLWSGGHFALHSINIRPKTFHWFFYWTIWITKINIIHY